MSTFTVIVLYSAKEFKLLTIMDQIRTISETINFVPYNYEYTFSAPRTDRLLIQDLLLSIHGAPSFTHPGGALGVSCNNVHFYIDGIDFTEPLLENLRINITKEDPKQIKDQYAFALNKWIELEDKMGAAYGNSDLQKEKDIVDKLLSTVPLSSTISQLGEVALDKYGWGGNLHIFNFLYKEIDIAPVSLQTIIQNYNANHPADKIEPGKIKRLTLSHGPCRLYSTVWNPSNIPAGSLHCLFEIRVHDTLEDRVKELEEQFESMKNDITTALDDIREIIINDTLQAIRDIKFEETNIATKIAQASTELTNHQLQLNAVKDSTQEILKAIQTI